MTETSAVKIMHAYLDALAESDFARVRGCLADHNFRYSSPISTFKDADAFVADISRVEAIMERIERRHTFVDGAEVCAIVDVKTSMSGLHSTPMALWATIVDGRITTMQAFFDAREYAAMFVTE